MKAINELLKEYIDKSNYTIYSLSYISKVNRTTLQRAISGERPISPENLNKLLPYLNLTPTEKKELDKSFLVSQIGEITYQKHMYIKDLIENINISDTSLYSEAGIPFTPISAPVQDCHMIKGQFNIIKVICQIISYNIVQESNTYLYAVSHFHNRFFSDLYEQLQIPYYSTLQIRHIAPFVKTSRGNTEASLFNLRLLSTLFPFALSNPTNCSLYYYYEENNSANVAGAPFTYYIICNHNVFLVSSDCETALILPDSAVAHYLQHFQQLLQNSLPLLDAVDTPSLLSIFISSTVNATFSHSLETQPCITAFVDNNIIRNSINEDLPEEQQQFLTTMLLSQCENLKKLNSSISIFNQAGYEDFVRNGLIYQIPYDLYHPLNTKDRITILNRMIQSNQTGSLKLYMVKDEVFHPQMELFTFDNSSILFTYTHPDTGQTQTCIIKEPNIIDSFNEFLMNLSGHDLVYDLEETSAIFQNSIQELKQLLPPPPNRRSE
ncbi:MAG: helix-turn-helix domain-containing protein [Lachnospiraceae bacterium]